ncbi:FmdB family zinc ribbon protein [Marinicella rhabdoformis]|uniref:FmdB family zinc ribbon protein n=1 Tax=Marinicella rhabdoformis TaxID=2580566 RepID=UPI0012AEC050|nr:FmdB family zinc ribbon protein [Marinicella rhabdoformis]
MPTYHYQASTENHCDHCVEGFDVMQKLAEAKLTQCPECGADIKKVICAPALTSQLTRDSKKTLSEQNIEKNGFTQYRKVGNGKYEKTAGKGPATIDRENL